MSNTINAIVRLMKPAQWLRLTREGLGRDMGNMSLPNKSTALSGIGIMGGTGGT